MHRSDIVADNFALAVVVVAAEAWLVAFEVLAVH
jgi:hypothetical protein